MTNNCVPACLSCNGSKSDTEVFYWYRNQRFYDPRRAMAIRAWIDGDLRLGIRLLQWAKPNEISSYKISDKHSQDKDCDVKAA